MIDSYLKLKIQALEFQEQQLNSGTEMLQQMQDTLHILLFICVGKRDRNKTQENTGDTQRSCDC